MLASLALALFQVADVAAAPPTGPTIVVRSAEGSFRSAAAVGGIDFEVLRMGERSVPVPEVFGYGRSCEPGPRIALGETDAGGEARVVLPDDVDVDEDGLPRVLVRVIEPGYQELTAQVWHMRGSSSPTARLVARRGATARGRVLDAEGNGVLAEVRVQRWIGTGSDRVLRGVTTARPLPDGHFELHLDEDLPSAMLVAEAANIGTAVLDGVDLLLSAPPQDLVLTTREGGSLRGVVVGMDGRAIPGLPLAVRLAAIDGDAYSVREPARSRAAAEGVGHVEVSTTTDAEGRFDVRGLRRDAYVVRARLDGSPVFGYATLLTPRPLSANGDEVRLLLEAPQLLVRVLDERGAPWAGEPLRMKPPASFGKEELGWHPAPRVRVVPASPIGRAPEVTGDALDLRSLSGHEVASSVEPGARYLVVVTGADYGTSVRLVEVPPAGGRVDVEVRAEPPEAWGKVRVRISTGRSGGDYEVWLEDPETGLRLCDVDATLGSVPTARAPIGRYRVVVEGCTFSDVMHGTVMNPRALGRAEAEVEVRADTTLEVPLEVRAGARIELLLEGQPNDADRAALLLEQPYLAEPHNAEALALLLASARVVLQRPQRGPEPVLRIVHEERTSAAGDHLSNAWPLNEVEESVPVAAGTWRLVARLPGGREVATEVVLREGETTRVRLEFPPPR